MLSIYLLFAGSRVLGFGSLQGFSDFFGFRGLVCGGFLDLERGPSDAGTGF